MDWPDVVANLAPVEDRSLPAVLRNCWPDAYPVPIEPQRLGRSSSAAFLACPNAPPHHLENAADAGPSYWDEIGGYHWLDFELIVAGERRPLRLVFNDGDADCNDGRWGGVWDLRTDARLADVESTGDCETTITERDELGGIDLATPASYVFNEEAHAAFYYDLPFPREVRLGRDTAFERVVLLAMRWVGYLAGVGL